jgi:hypothetical protein
LVFAPNPVVAMHNGKPTLMVRIGNGRAAILADAAAKLNVLLSETTTEGKRIRRAQELRLFADASAYAKASARQGRSDTDSAASPERERERAVRGR